MTYKSDGKIDTSKLGTNVGDITIYLGLKAEVGAIVKGGVNLGIYVLANKSTGKVEVSGSLGMSFGSHAGASASLGGEVAIFPMATRREDIASAYFSYSGNMSIKERAGIGGSFSVLVPIRKGELTFDSGVGVIFGGSASLGWELPASIIGGASGGVNTKWIPLPLFKASFFNKFEIKKVQNVINKLDKEKIKKEYNKFKGKKGKK